MRYLAALKELTAETPVWGLVSPGTMAVVVGDRLPTEKQAQGDQDARQ